MNKKNLIESSTKVLLLKKTINGLIQGAFNQYRNMGKTFAKEGFKVDPNEPGLFYNISKKGIIIIALWVDDFIIAYSREVEKEALAIIMRLTPNLLLKETKGKLLGMELVETDEAFYLSSTRYIEDKISEMKLPILTDNQYKVKTPIHYKDEVKPEDEYDPKLLLEYQKVIGSLIHASNSLRMDISYSVGVLSRNITRVDKNLLDIAYRVMNYLYTTKNYRLSFKRRKEETKLSAYVDADFAGDYESRKSTTGFIICLSGIPIYWRSKLQTSVATRTAEAEIIALYDVSQEILYYRNILNNMEMNPGTVKIYEDNQAAIAIMSRPEKKTKMRHLDAKYFKIQELITDKIVSLEYVKSENNLSDMMTKSLSKALHNGIIKRLGLWPMA